MPDGWVVSYVVRAASPVNAASPGDHRSVCEQAHRINLFRALITYLKPVLPNMAERSELFLKVGLNWYDLDAPLLAHELNDFQPLLQRVDPDSVKAMVEDGKS